MSETSTNGRLSLAVGHIAAEMRLQQIASFDDVQWAILETNGSISFIPR